MVIFLVFLLSFFFFSKQSLALDDFTTTQTTNYKIDQTGQALVKKTVDLTNNYSEIYPKKYQITIYDFKIENISATHNGNNILQSIDRQNDQTIINLKFDQANIGKNKTNQINLFYKLPNLAQKKGKIWEIHLPYQKENTFTQDEITLNVPENFGRLSFSSLQPSKQSLLNQTRLLTFSQNQNTNKKILLTFGEYQAFDFSLDYFLENSSTFPVEEKIPIPPDTNTQKIIYQQISPSPNNVSIDNDGNWMASYQIPPQQELKINLSGQVKITPPDISFPKTIIDQNQLLQSQKFWPVNDPQIQQIAKNLNNPKQIYDYVINHLNYNYQQINTAKRKGALFALQNPNQSLCTEFTDLFITLARAKGIPAREVEGFVFTNNPKIKPTSTSTDILHAWPQYFDPKQQLWISIDPTWAKTTKGIDYFDNLDLNHFAFVFHGQDSLYPPPPGSYKNNKNIKTVNVNFSQEEIKPNILLPQIKLENNNLVVKNSQLFALHQLSIALPSQNWQHTIEVLPPLASITIPPPLPFSLFSFLPKNKNYQFKISAQNQDLGQVSINNPDHLPQTIISFLILMTIITIGCIILKRQFAKKT